MLESAFLILMGSAFLMTVVDDVEDPAAQIALENARKLNKKAKLGDDVGVPVDAKKFGRIAAQAAKQVIIQGIREAERGIIYDEFNSKEHALAQTGGPHRRAAAQGQQSEGRRAGAALCRQPSPGSQRRRLGAQRPPYGRPLDCRALSQAQQHL